MSIPNDPLKRWWVECADENPQLVSEIRPSLIAFLAFDNDHIAKIAGTGFFIAGTPEYAIAISAKHVFTEGVLNIQRPMPQYSLSAIFVAPTSRNPSITPEKLKAMWMGDNDAAALNIGHISYNETLDIACGIIMPQEPDIKLFKPVSVPLDIRTPETGDVIHMMALEGMEALEISPPTTPTGMGLELKISGSVSIRTGVVTAVYPKGFRQYKWPCFTTSIPAKAGMSGGFVALPPIHGAPHIACGIVCADNSSDESHSDQFLCGESVIACAWPALSLYVPTWAANNAPVRTLYEMIQCGDLYTKQNILDEIEIQI